MATKRRSGKREKRLLEMADDVAEDMSIRKLAEKYGISVGQAHADAQQIRDDWNAARLENDSIERRRSVQIARLTRAIQELWAAWHASKGLRVKTREEQRPGPLEQVPGVVVVQENGMIAELLRPGELITVKRFTQTYDSPGDPRYMERLLQAYDQVAKVDGLYAMKEITLNVRNYLELVAEELGIDADDLIAEAEEVAEQAWRASSR
jgi:hypothetical protein